MASSIFFVNTKGDEIVGRHYRSDIPRSSIDAFRSKIIATKSTGSFPPVTIIDGTSFAYIRHRNLFLIAATRSNPNILLILEYLLQFVRIIKSYLGEKFTDEDLKANFTLVYELFDETMDYGYPQSCSIDVLKLYINSGGTSEKITNNPATSGAQLTAQITGAIDWRREGIRHRNNEIYIDIHEIVTVHFSQTGQVLRNEILGKVLMRSYLSGMPECKFGLNDKLIMDKEGGGSGAKSAGVELDDCSFHRCVRLGKFDSERTITFIPPDGEFELMKYRVSSQVQPFTIIPSITEISPTQLSVNVRISSHFPAFHKATSVVVKIPMPPSASTASFRLIKGKAKYDPGQRALIWKLSQVQGGTEYTLDATVNLFKGSRNKTWNRPPITLDFNIPMYTASGVEVRFLKVYEKSSYQHNKWVKYNTKSGEYQMKI